MTDAANPLDNKQAIAQMGQELPREYEFSTQRIHKTYHAAGEQNRALLSALASTNGRVDNLERGVG